MKIVELVMLHPKRVNRCVFVWSRFRVMVQGLLEVVLKREQRGWRAGERTLWVAHESLKASSMLECRVELKFLW